MLSSSRHSSSSSSSSSSVPCRYRWCSERTGLGSSGSPRAPRCACRCVPPARTALAPARRHGTSSYRWVGENRHGHRNRWAVVITHNALTARCDDGKNPQQYSDSTDTPLTQPGITISRTHTPTIRPKFPSLSRSPCLFISLPLSLSFSHPLSLSSSDTFCHTHSQALTSSSLPERRKSEMSRSRAL